MAQAETCDDGSTLQPSPPSETSLDETVGEMGWCEGEVNIGALDELQAVQSEMCYM